MHLAIIINPFILKLTDFLLLFFNLIPIHCLYFRCFLWCSSLLHSCILFCGCHIEIAMLFLILTHIWGSSILVCWCGGPWRPTLQIRLVLFIPTSTLPNRRNLPLHPRTLKITAFSLSSFVFNSGCCATASGSVVATPSTALMLLALLVNISPVALVSGPLLLILVSSIFTLQDVTLVFIALELFRILLFFKVSATSSLILSSTCSWLRPAMTGGTVFGVTTWNTFYIWFMLPRGKLNAF